MPPTVCPKQNALTCLGLCFDGLPEQIFISQPMGIVPREPISYIVLVVQGCVNPLLRSGHWIWNTILIGA